MKNLPDTYFFKKSPKEYLTQGRNHCGMYAIKGILSAYGLDNKNNPADYHPTKLGKIFGSTLPWTFSEVFKQYNLSTRIGWNQGTEEEKLKELKHLIFNNKGLILLIGNGYGKDGVFHNFQSKITAHWISVWGYNDREKVFYIYDSALPKNLYSKNIPVGNTKRSYNDVLRDCSALPVSPLQNMYIKVN